MKLKVSKGELIISNSLEMADDYLPGGVGATPPPALVRVKILLNICVTMCTELNEKQNTQIPFGLIFQYGHFRMDTIEDNNTDISLSKKRNISKYSKILELFLTEAPDLMIDFSAIFINDLTPFLWSCKNGLLNLAEILMEKFLNFEMPEYHFNAVDESGQTAFHLSCQYGHLNIAEMLIDKSIEFKIELNLKHHGKTAFHMASQNGHSKIAEMIIQKSADYGIDLSA